MTVKTSVAVAMITTATVALLACLVDTTAAAGPIKGPPTADKKEVTRVARLGEKEVRLTCPMSGFPAPIISWTKGKEDITNYEWIRYKTVRKSLRIRDVAKEDTGIYVCKGTNGFGSEEIRIDLIVIDPAEHPELAEGDLPDMAPPVFTEDTLAVRTDHVKETGENLRLTCEALGKPEPEVVWLRNNRQVTYDDRGSGGGQSAGGMRRRSGKATLVIKNLIDADSGMFTCKAKNMLGTIARNFTLTVRESSHHPVLLNEPENTTVQQGETAYLECRVQSTTTPYIKWLKKLESGEHDETVIVGGDNEHHEPDIFDLGEDNKFRVIEQKDVDGEPSDENVDLGNNEYVNRLTIPQASQSDAGMYYCFVTNTVGYKYKNAYLTVVPKKTLQSTGNDSTLIVLATIGVIGLIFAIVVAFLCLCRRRHKRPTVETPEIQENLMRQHYMQQQQQQHQQQHQHPLHQHHHHHGTIAAPPTNIQQHPRQYIYQQQQYQASLINNNGPLKVAPDHVAALPPPPPTAAPPPSVHSDTDSKWSVYPPNSVINMTNDVSAVTTATTNHSGGSSTYNPSLSGGQNQYEVPHTTTTNTRHHHGHSHHRHHAYGGGGGGGSVYGSQHHSHMGQHYNY